MSRIFLVGLVCLFVVGCGDNEAGSREASGAANAEAASQSAPATLSEEDDKELVRITTNLDDPKIWSSKAETEKVNEKYNKHLPMMNGPDSRLDRFELRDDKHIYITGTAVNVSIDSIDKDQQQSNADVEISKMLCADPVNVRQMNNGLTFHYITLSKESEEITNVIVNKESCKDS